MENASIIFAESVAGSPERCKQEYGMSVSPIDLQPVDNLEVLVLVDNVMDILSSTHRSVTTQIPNLIDAGMEELGGSCLCCGAWGLSLVISTRVGGRKKRLLFDSGPESYALERNASRLGFNMGSIDCAAVSHGHFDHMGGMLKALEMISASNGGKPTPLHVNPGMFAKRASQDSPGGEVLPLEDVPSLEALAASGAELINSDEPRLIMDDTVYISGEIPRITTYEKGLPTQVRLDEQADWIPDPLQLDERYLAVHVKDRGIVVFSSCSHAGIVNVLSDASDVSGPISLHAVMGGLHLSGPHFEKIIPQTVADLSAFNLRQLVVGHCTGWRAYQALVNAFGDSVVLQAVGNTHRFGDD